MSYSELTEFVDTRIDYKTGNGNGQKNQHQDPHVELSDNMPTGFNFGRCKNGNCGTVVKNANSFTTDYRSCPDCKFNGIPISTNHKDSLCPACGRTHNREDLDNSDIEIPEGND